MNYNFNDIYSRAKAVLETDRYVMYQTIKSKTYFSGNYLLIKKLPETLEELEYYIQACKAFFKDKGIVFTHLALPENKEFNRKLKKYLKKEGFNEIHLELYHLDISNFIDQDESNYQVEVLQKIDYSKFLKFNYDIDLEVANEEWANHNQNILYEELRAETITQLVAKDQDKIIGVVNVIQSDGVFEIDSLYIDNKYRRKGIATHLISYAIKKFKKKNVILLADFNDTPKYMYEKMGFKKISERIYYLKNE